MGNRNGNSPQNNGHVGVSDEASPATGSTSKKETTNIVLRLIQDHYRHTKYVKSDEQIEGEKWLLPKVPFNRWMTLPAAVIVQFCVGSLYAWSVFNKPIDILIYGHSNNTAPITFYIACGLLGFSAAVMGPWLERHGPRTSCLLGTALFCSGHFLTALALYTKQIWLVFLGYGVIGGFGTGLCYISPVSALQKWFPDRRGLASGFAVCGFGAGSIAIAKAQIPLINAVGLPLTFAILGGIYFVVMSLAALVLRTPPPDFSVNGMRSDRSAVETETKQEIEISKDHCGLNMPGAVNEEKAPPSNDLTLVESLLSNDFRLMYIMFFGNVIYGLCAISRLSNMVTDIFGRSSEEASTIVSINGGFNLGGRLIFSIISDYFGRKGCFTIMLTTQLIIIATFSTITSYGAYWTFVVTMWILTACYGGGFGTIPAFLTDRFGPSNVGACHGVILTGWSISGIAGGFIFTAVYDYVLSNGYSATDAFPYNVNSWWICAIVLLGWISLIFVSPTDKDLNFRTKVIAGFKKLFTKK